MNKDVHDILNRYIAAELGRSFVLPDVTELSRQRSAFLAHFGPEQLAKMSGPELLRQLPHNASNDQPMDCRLPSCGAASAASTTTAISACARTGSTSGSAGRAGAYECTSLDSVNPLC